MNRYQKPEIYNQLAMEYSLGTLRGRARKRFEQLMEQHPYLQAIVEDYDLKFAELSTLLPETKPADSVWEAIQSAINKGELRSSTTEEENVAADVTVSNGWWEQFIHNLSTKKYQGFATALLVLVLASFLLLKISPVSHADVRAVTATLKSETTHEPMVDVLVAKDNMKMIINLKQPVEVPDGMKMVFWCIAKDQSKPYMNMGEVASQGKTEKKIKPANWKGILEASQFAVSIEPEAAIDSPVPSKKLIFIGDLIALK